MSKDQRIYLRDVLERIRRIEEVMASGEDIVRTSSMHQDAIMRNFEVIGEIVKRLDPALTTRVPDFPWSRYARFRDLLIHQYDKVILDTVLDSAQNDLTPLKRVVGLLLDQLGTDMADNP